MRLSWIFTSLVSLLVASTAAHGISKVPPTSLETQGPNQVSTLYKLQHIVKYSRYT